MAYIRKKPLTPGLIERVAEMIKANYSFSTIASEIGVSYHSVSKVFQTHFIFKPDKQPEIVVNHTKQQYYKLESDIEAELNLSYSVDDLEGEELEILNEIIKNG